MQSTLKNPIGRKPLTGNFATRQELTDEVWWIYTYCRSAPTRQIAHRTGITPSLVNRILTNREGLDHFLARYPDNLAGKEISSKNS